MGRRGKKAPAATNLQEFEVPNGHRFMPLDDSEKGLISFDEREAQRMAHRAYFAVLKRSAMRIAMGRGADQAFADRILLVPADPKAPAIVFPPIKFVGIAVPLEVPPEQPSSPAPAHDHPKEPSP